MSATIDDVLSLLDEINEQGRIEYMDYSQLHDVIAATMTTVDGSTRYHELFGTPERAAQTIEKQCDEWHCVICPARHHDCNDGNYDALLEWLRGDA